MGQDLVRLALRNWFVQTQGSSLDKPTVLVSHRLLLIPWIQGLSNFCYQWGHWKRRCSCEIKKVHFIFWFRFKFSLLRFLWPPKIRKLYFTPLYTDFNIKNHSKTSFLMWNCEKNGNRLLLVTVKGMKIDANDQLPFCHLIKPFEKRAFWAIFWTKWLF